MSKKPRSDEPKLTYRIPTDGTWSTAWKIAAILGAVGTVGSILGAISDPHRFAFSWLFAFMVFLAVGLGGLFITLMFHITGAAWAVVVRRTSELMMAGLPVFALLFIPVAMHVDELYPWATHHGDEHGEEHEGDGDVVPAMHEEEHGMLELDAPSVAHAQEARERWDLRPSEWETPVHGENADGAAGSGEHHDPEHAIHAEILASKGGYLNKGFFYGRAVFYLAVWILLSMFFFFWTTRQDREKGLAITNRMQGLAPLGTILFGITLTFAAFDWMMSLEPSWFSTIFGVQYFAGCAVSGFAVHILIMMSVRRAGIIGNAVNVDHFHDVGKLLFGFIVFWAYISFSQFLLIWYAGIPEETTYYHLRWWGGGGFQNVSILLMLGHFIVPFIVLLSRNAKRNLPVLAFACAWILVFHVVEGYWLVMPYAEQTSLVFTSLHVHWMDLTALFAVGGIYFSTVFFLMTRHPLVPIGDPRLERSLAWEQ